MAKARIGHFVEAQVLEALGVDYIDESEVLTPADEENHIDKHAFKVPVRVRLPRPRRGAPPDRRGRGDDAHQGRGRHRQHRRGRPPHPDRQRRASAASQAMREDELFAAAKELRAPLELVREVAADGKLPVVNFVAGGIATPADAALAMQLGRRGRLRRLGHLQERGPGPDGQRDRPGDHPLRQPEDHRRGQQGPGRADARASRSRRSRRASGWRSAAGSDATAGAAADRAGRLAPVRIGVLARAGRLRRARRRRSRAIGVEAVEVRLPEDLDRRRGPDPARRREHHDAQAHRPLGPARADPGPGPLRRADLRHLRRDDPARDGDRRRRGAGPPAARRDRRAQRVRPPARLVRGRPRRARPRRRARSTASSSGPRSSSEVGPGRRRPGPPRRRADRGRPPAQRDRHRVPPRARRRDALPPPGGHDGRRARRPGRGLRPPAAPAPAREARA